MKGDIFIMAEDYEQKEDKTLDKISNTFNNLDDALAKEDTDLENNHKTRAWFEEHRAIHEVKKALHEIGKYDKFDEDEYNRFMKDYEKAIEDFNN